jgi:protease-4
MFSKKTNEPEIAIINIEGPIETKKRKFSTSKVVNSNKVTKKIRDITEKDHVKALLLKINSPGGSAAGSKEIYEEILRFKNKTGKKVFASMQDMAASGGYYIAMAADKVFANHSTITGSIGVIMQFANLQELNKKIGIEHNTFTSGTFKDIGNPNREMSVEEKAHLDEMVHDVYEQFLKVVSKGRDFSYDKAEEIADGNIYTGKQAKELGLVDGLKTFYQVIDQLKKELGSNYSDLKINTYNDESDGLLSKIKKIVSGIPNGQNININLKGVNTTPNIGIRYELKQ